MANTQFAEINNGVTNRSRFNMSNTHTTTLNFGQLIPIYLQECVPGDHISLDNKVFVQQIAPLACPTFGSVRASVKTFFVPNRIIWKNWMKFITGGSDGSTLVTPPQIMAGTVGRMSRWELSKDNDTTYWPYLVNFPRGTFSALISNLGLGDIVKHAQNFLIDDPIKQYSDGDTSTPESTFPWYISTLPARAYQRIWWDYYRDSRLIDDNLKDAYLNDGDNLTQNLFTYTKDSTSGITTVAYNSTPSTWNTSVREWLTRYACYDKDYFTTASLHPQVGTNPSYVNDEVRFIANKGSFSYIRHDSPSVAATKIGIASNQDGSTMAQATLYAQEGNVTKSAITPNYLLQTNFTVEQIRQASAMQKYLESKNIAGGRYIQQLFAQFGIKASADRLDMAEFIDGRRFDIDFNTVTSSVGTEDDALGTKGATMQAFGNNRAEYTATEHGFIMSIMDIMPDVQYSQGIDPIFNRRKTKEDYFQPEFEQTGFEAIRTGEMYLYEFGVNTNVADTINTSPDDVFGYTPRYANMKWHRSVVAGDFDRMSTNGARLLDAYNTNRLFSQVPELNADFVELNGGSRNNTTLERSYNRIFSNTSGYIDHFLINVFNDCQMVRPMQPLAAPTVPCEDDNGKTLRVPFGGIRVN